MTKVYLTRAADEDIDRIIADLLKSSQSLLIRDRFVDALVALFGRLGRMPYIGRARPELGEELRSIPVWHCMLFYYLQEESVVISRVKYQREDISETEFPDLTEE